MGNYFAGGGTIWGAVSSYRQGNAQKDAAQAGAKRIEAEGQAAGGRVRAKARRLAATQRTRFAAAGIDLSGSTIDVQYDSAVQAEVDAMSAIYSANVRAANLRTQGFALKQQGKNALMTGLASGIGQMFGSFGGSQSQEQPTFVNSGNGNVSESSSAGSYQREYYDYAPRRDGEQYA